jgi:hypothetical protein
MRLFFDAEVGGDTFLRNVRSHTNHIDGNIHNYRCENLRCYVVFLWFLA